jgi:hypothetical protein
MTPEAHEPRKSPEAQRALDALRGFRSPTYDVEAGLVRHRDLIAQGALPALASKPWWAWGASKLGWLTLSALVSLGVFHSLRGLQTPLVDAAPSSREQGSDVDGVMPVVTRASPTGRESMPTPGGPAPAPREGGRTSPPAVDDLTARPAQSPPANGAPRLSRHPRTPVLARSSHGELSAAKVQAHGRGPTVQAGADARASSAEQPTNAGTIQEPPSVPAPATPEDPAAREIAELAHAERLLSSFPTRALALARESDARFHPGYLRQERRTLIVRALLASGEGDAAEREAARFLREDPDPSFRKRLERSLLRK